MSKTPSQADLATLIQVLQAGAIVYTLILLPLGALIWRLSFDVAQLKRDAKKDESLSDDLHKIEGRLIRVEALLDTRLPAIPHGGTTQS